MSDGVGVGPTSESSESGGGSTSHQETTQPSPLDRQQEHEGRAGVGGSGVAAVTGALPVDTGETQDPDIAHGEDGAGTADGSEG